MKAIKFLGKGILKLAVLPVLGVVVLIKWVAMFLTHCSAWIFRLLAGIFFLTAILCGLMEIENGESVLQMMLKAFIIFVIPVIGETIVNVADIMEGFLMGVEQS